MDNKIKLQIALDMLDMKEAMNVLASTSDFVDIIEIGTPFLKYQGINALRLLRKKFPDKEIFVDTKTMDVGKYEADFCFAEGADMVSILGAADDETIYSGIESAKENGKKIMVDLIGVKTFFDRAKFLEKLDLDYIGIHSGIDQQKMGKSPLEDLKLLSSVIKKPLSVAGGIGLNNINAIVMQKPGIVVIGGAITQAKNPGEIARLIWGSINEREQKYAV